MIRRGYESQTEPLMVVNRRDFFSTLDGKQSSKQVRRTKLFLGNVPLTSEKYILCYSFSFLT